MRPAAETQMRLLRTAIGNELVAIRLAISIPLSGAQQHRVAGPQQPLPQFDRFCRKPNLLR